jgi:regulator of protease activity HflC (stomatin/prohibitin superfamily)
MTWDQYKATGKDFAKEDTDKLDADLKNLGVRFENLTMSDPELNATIQDAMELRFRAEEEAAAKREKGKGEKDYAISIGEGTARVTELNAVANRKRFEELVTLFRGKGMSDVVATEEAIRVILETQNAEAIGKLTTYVAGGSNTGIVLNPGDKKP